MITATVSARLIIAMEWKYRSDAPSIMLSGISVDYRQRYIAVDIRYCNSEFFFGRGCEELWLTLSWQR